MTSLKQVSRVGLGAILFAGVAIAALAQPAEVSAPAPAQAQAADPGDARIDKLEAEVQALAAEVDDLKRGQAAQIDTLAGVQSSIPGQINTAVAAALSGKH